MIWERTDELLVELEDALWNAAVGYDLEGVERTTADALDTAASVSAAALRRGDHEEAASANGLRDAATAIARLAFRVKSLRDRRLRMKARTPSEEFHELAAAQVGLPTIEELREQQADDQRRLDTLAEQQRAQQEQELARLRRQEERAAQDRAQEEEAALPRWRRRR